MACLVDACIQHRRFVRSPEIVLAIRDGFRARNFCFDTLARCEQVEARETNQHYSACNRCSIALACCCELDSNVTPHAWQSYVLPAVDLLIAADEIGFMTAVRDHFATKMFPRIASDRAWTRENYVHAHRAACMKLARLQHTLPKRARADSPRPDAKTRRHDTHADADVSTTRTE
jgi:hypothetical protein